MMRSVKAKTREWTAPTMRWKPHFETWEDVVRWARAKIVESAKYNGDGEDGRAAWYEKQPPDWRPDFTGVPITPLPKPRMKRPNRWAWPRRLGRAQKGGARISRGYEQRHFLVDVGSSMWSLFHSLRPLRWRLSCYGGRLPFRPPLGRQAKCQLCRPLRYPAVGAISRRRENRRPEALLVQAIGRMLEAGGSILQWASGAWRQPGAFGRRAAEVGPPAEAAAFIDGA
jgi:hypothetical protein